MLQKINIKVRELSPELKTIISNIPKCDNCEATQDIQKHQIAGQNMHLCKDCYEETINDYLDALDEQVTMQSLHWDNIKLR